jgi:hypothetical protein
MPFRRAIRFSKPAHLGGLTRWRLRLALGVEIPANVELYEFAPVILERIPKLSHFRFVVTEDQLVIVAPQDRSVALVLDR